MNADVEVMADLGGPISREDSDAKFERYRQAFDRLGFSRWVVRNRQDNFLGYAGVLPGQDGPLEPHYEIGWRLVRSAWGQGYAPEAAKATLTDVFERVGLTEVLAYTAPTNARSIAVMTKLGMARQPQLDFTALYNGRSWSGLVWVARPSRPDSRVTV